jgi:hypothetical protein
LIGSEGVEGDDVMVIREVGGGGRVLDVEDVEVVFEI